MSINISDLKSRLNSKIHNSINKVQDINGLIYEAAGNLLRVVDPAETIRVAQLSNALYDKVYDYQAPSDLKDDRIISLLPQVNATPAQNYSQTYPKAFGLRKIPSTLSVKNNSGLKTLLISATNIPAGATINDANSLTSNGTWSAGGNASNLSVDSLNFVSGGSSLKFDITASGSSAYIENSTMQSVDCTNYVNTGSVFVYVYIPSTTIITSIELRLGSDSSNYYSQTVTTTQDNTSFVLGWNLLRFDWASFSQVGTPVTTAIDYARVTFNYNGTAIASCRVDNIVIRNGSIYELTYYSSYLFKNTSGTWIEKPTSIDDSDIVNLDTTGINLLIDEMAFLAAQEIGAQDSSFDVAFFEKQKANSYMQYKFANKSQALKRQEPYYRHYVRRRR